MQIQLPSPVAKIIHIIEEAGYEAFAVGGCIRDSILGREPNDWDITTSALPQKVKELFPRTIDTGLIHGTVTVMMDHVGYEVTTYRIDGIYEDNRHPSQVTFTPDLVEDLKRRDFTINAMAYNDSRGLVDVFDGVGDLERGVIRAVGDAEKRFEEDALRMMRAVRFAAQLGYEIEDKTRQAICTLHQNLQNISAERIQTELIKLLTSSHPEHMRLLYETKITQVIMPRFDRMMQTEQNHPHHCYSVGEHTIVAMQNVRNDKVLRLTMLFHDMAKPEVITTDEQGIHHFHGHAELSEKIAKETLRELKFDNDTIRKVSKLVLYHDRTVPLDSKGVKKALNLMGEEIFLLLLEVKNADVLAQSMYKREEKLQYIQDLKVLYNKVKEQKECFCLKDLAISGKDLMALGMTPGPGIGVTLETLLSHVIENPEDNQKETLIKMVQKGMI